MQSDFPLKTQDLSIQTQSFQMDQTVLKMERFGQVGKGQTQEDMKKAAQQFEGIFLKMMFEQMDKTVQRGDFLSGGDAETTFRGFFYDEITQRMATGPGGSGLGIADQIYKQMLQSQATKDASSTVDKQG